MTTYLLLLLLLLLIRGSNLVVKRVVDTAHLLLPVCLVIASARPGVGHKASQPSGEPVEPGLGRLRLLPVLLVLRLPMDAAPAPPLLQLWLGEPDVPELWRLAPGGRFCLVIEIVPIIDSVSKQPSEDSPLRINFFSILVIYHLPITFYQLTPQQDVEQPSLDLSSSIQSVFQTV